MEKVFLLADDDSDDADLFKEALGDVDHNIFFYRATDGHGVLSILNDTNFKQPQIIFLDLNMPEMNGWQCLTKLKASSAFSHIPVIMYSTSSNQREVDIALDLGAMCFFTKPSNFKELKGILEVVVNNLNGGLLEAIGRFNGIKFKSTFFCS